MARGYPRFLFSNPTNTKTPGPFIVHMLEPRVVFQVFTADQEPLKKKCMATNRGVGISLLDDVPCDEDDPAGKVLEDALDWLLHQIHYGFIKL